jgi:hypothetical protein
MRTLTKLFTLALLLGLGFPEGAQAQDPGNCSLGIASQDLDINNVRARLFNKGNLFYDGSTLYEVPVGSGISPVFAGAIWIGGTVNGQVRTAAATYAQGEEDYEFWPGPLNDDGTLPNPDDCSEFDRMYKVSVTDIASYIATGNATPDLRDWPVGLGAPACIDENNDGRCAPSEPQVEVTSRDQSIDLSANQIPDILGDQGIWWIMNDVGNQHATTLTPPIGMEVSVLAFAVSRADALGDATFYQYTFNYKGSATLENTFLTIWSDPDLGNYEDDYIGSDPELGLGFVYNADNDDEVGAGGYGANPPALGYDFFVGPVTDADDDGDLDTLGMTKFGYFNNDSNPRTGNPDTFSDFYNYMRGLWKDGTPWTEGGQAVDQTNPPVDFVYPNSGSLASPTPGYWSEFCPTPDCTTANEADDRRFIMSTGPFSMEPGETQQVIYGIVWAQGANNVSSLQAVKTADELAQRFFDLNFQIAPPPPAPSAEAVELSGSAAITWSYPDTGDPAITNYLGGYDAVDPLIGGLAGVEDSTYTFEGFNVYRYPDADFATADRELIATYDVINFDDEGNPITVIIDEELDPNVGQVVPFVVPATQLANNTGLQFYHIIEGQLTNYQDYFYGITAYAYNEESTPDIVESQAATVVVRPADLIAAESGTRINADLGNALVGDLLENTSGNAILRATVVDPAALTGASYTVRFSEVELDEDGEETAFTFRIVNEDTGEVAFDGVELFEEDGLLVEPGERSIVVDGISFFTIEEPTLPELIQPLDGDGVTDFAGDGRGIVEIAHPNADVCEEGSTDVGCRFYGGNTVWLNENSTGSYVITVEGNDREDLLDADIIGSDDFELRFTEECATEGACLGAYVRDGEQIVSVPFELWNVGSLQDATDDVRMIPMIRDEGDDLITNWEDTFTWSTDVIVGADTTEYPVTEPVFWMMPDRPNGYELFEEAARDFGGPGAIYDFENDGDDQIDLNANGAECARQGWYIDFCYRDVPPFRAPIGDGDGMLLADITQGNTTPPPGTTVRFRVIPDPLLYANTVYEIDTEGLGVEVGVGEVAEDALDRIGVVPNPYRGFSTYETGNFDRRVRFINLPDQATIRIFTLSGTLIRVLRTNNTRSFDWDLETEGGLPVASGMYLVHVDTPAGEVVLKLAVVNRESRFNVF